jgi:hypothetical protein
MSLEIPTNIERDIQRFAQQERITHDEAVLRLIETGLDLPPGNKSSVNETSPLNIAR